MLLRLDVDVRRAIAQGLGEDEVHDLDDRRGLVDAREQRRDELRRGRPGLLVAADGVADVPEHAVALGDRLVDIRPQREERPDRDRDPLLQLRERLRVGRERHREDQAALLDADRQDVAALRKILGHELEGLVVGALEAEIDERRIELEAQDRGEIRVADEPLVDEDLAERCPGDLLPRERALDRDLVHEAGLDEQLPDPLPGRACRRVQGHGKKCRALARRPPYVAGTTALRRTS